MGKLSLSTQVMVVSELRPEIWHVNCWSVAVTIALLTNSTAEKWGRYKVRQHMSFTQNEETLKSTKVKINENKVVKGQSQAQILSINPSRITSALILGNR